MISFPQWHPGKAAKCGVWEHRTRDAEDALPYIVLEEVAREARYSRGLAGRTQTCHCHPADL